jgi:hypothetical protein
MNLSNRSKFDIGFTGFGEFATSVFTVYQAASQVQQIHQLKSLSPGFMPASSDTVGFEGAADEAMWIKEQKINSF